jgi:PAS domain S-box-containing protein
MAECQGCFFDQDWRRFVGMGQSNRTVHSNSSWAGRAILAHRPFCRPPPRSVSAKSHPMINDLRKSGVGAVGDIPWGTHFCHFYANKTELLEVLIPYFKAGLEQNEFCLWEVFGPLNLREAKIALERALPGARARVATGDIEIVPRQLAHDWDAKLQKALAKGYAGMRVNANGARLEKGGQQSSDAYEDEFSGLIADRPMILLCSYPLTAGHAAEILKAGSVHRCAIARRHGNWQVVEAPELRQAREEVHRLRTELERRAIERTEEVAKADADRKLQVLARHRAEEALRACAERSLCFFELGLVGMAIVSPSQGCLEVNQRLCDMLGYARAELMRMTWAAMVHPDDLAVDVLNYGRIVSGEVDGYHIAKRWIRKNGDVIHTNASLKCQRREDGSIDYFAAMVQEVTGLGPSPTGDPAGDWDLREGTQVLSSREREVMRLIGFGKTVKEIAAGLALSEKTVSTYRTRMLTKLKLKSTAELIRYALKNRLSE